MCGNPAKLALFKLIWLIPLGTLCGVLLGGRAPLT